MCIPTAGRFNLGRDRIQARAQTLLKSVRLCQMGLAGFPQQTEVFSARTRYTNLPEKRDIEDVTASSLSYIFHDFTTSSCRRFTRGLGQYPNHFSIQSSNASSLSSPSSVTSSSSRLVAHHLLVTSPGRADPAQVGSKVGTTVHRSFEGVLAYSIAIEFQKWCIK